MSTGGEGGMATTNNEDLLLFYAQLQRPRQKFCKVLKNPRKLERYLQMRLMMDLVQITG